MEETPVIEEQETFVARSPRPRMRRAGTRSGSALDLLRAAMRARQPFPTPTDAEAPDRARAVAQISTAIAELASAGLLGASASWVLASRHGVSQLLGLRSRLETAPPPLMLACVLAVAAASLLLVHAIAPVNYTPRRRRDAKKKQGGAGDNVGGGNVHIPPPSPPPRLQSSQRGPWLLVIVLNTTTLLSLIAGGAMTGLLRSQLPLEHVTAYATKDATSAQRSRVPSLEGVGGATHRDSWTKSRVQMRLRKGPFGDQLRTELEDSLKCCKHIWDHMQTKLACCGVDGPADWRKYGIFPKSCCKGNGECHPPWVDEDKNNSAVTLGSERKGTKWKTDGCLVPAALYMAEGMSLLIGLACVLGIFVTGSLVLSGALWAREVRHRTPSSADGSPPPSARASVAGADVFAVSTSFVADADDSFADVDGAPGSAAAAASLDACFSSSSSSDISATESVRGAGSGGQRPASAFVPPSRSATVAGPGPRPASARIRRHVEQL